MNEANFLLPFNYQDCSAHLQHLFFCKGLHVESNFLKNRSSRAQWAWSSTVHVNFSTQKDGRWAPVSGTALLHFRVELLHPPWCWSFHLLTFCWSCVSALYFSAPMTITSSSRTVGFIRLQSLVSGCDFSTYVKSVALTVKEGIPLVNFPWMPVLMLLLMLYPSQNAQGVLLAWTLPAWGALAQTEVTQPLQMGCLGTMRALHCTV